jgi:hypothetical protein
MWNTNSFLEWIGLSGAWISIGSPSLANGGFANGGLDDGAATGSGAAAAGAVFAAEPASSAFDASVFGFSSSTIFPDDSVRGHRRERVSQRF